MDGAPTKTLQDMIDNLGNRYRTDSKGLDRTAPIQTRFDSKAFASALKASNDQIKSSDRAIKNMMLQRAVLQERFEAARSSGDKMAALAAKKQLDMLEEQKQVIAELKKLEQTRLDITSKRNTLEARIADSRYDRTRALRMQIAAREFNDELFQTSEAYDTQIRLVKKISEGVMDVKKAQELVTEEIAKEQAQLEHMSKNLFGKLGSVMADQFGEGWDRIKSDIKDKVALFTKVGVAVGFGVAAMRDLSKDSDEVINTLYRMGGSLDRVDNKFGYYTSSILALNRVQTSLRESAALMNMPIEAVDGLTESIMQSTRILDSAGKIDMKRVRDVGETALNFARRTGISTQESVQIISHLMNKYGQSADKADDVMNGLIASVVMANDKLEDLGKGKAAIFIEDIANLIKEAADNSETFSLDLEQLGKVASNQMVIAKKFGATYSEALKQAGMLTEYLNKRNPYTNYMAGMTIAKGIQDDADAKPYIEKKDVAGLTTLLNKKYGLETNEANIVAKAIIGKQGNWMQTVGQFMGGTKAGMQAITGRLEQLAVQGAKTQAATGGTDMAALTLMAREMGLEPDSNEMMSLFNTFVEAANERLSKGQPLTGFIRPDDFQGEKFDEAKRLNNAKGTESQSPITPTMLRELLDSVFTSPFNRLVIAAGAMVTAFGFQFAALKRVGATLTEILMAVRTNGIPGAGHIAADGTPIPSGIPTTGDAGNSKTPTGTKRGGFRGKVGGAWSKAKTTIAANRTMIGAIGTPIAMIGGGLVLDWARNRADADMMNEDGSRKTYFDAKSDELSKQIESNERILNDKTLQLSKEQRDAYEMKLLSLKRESDLLSLQNKAFIDRKNEYGKNKALIEAKIRDIKNANDPEIKRQMRAQLQALQSRNEQLEPTLDVTTPELTSTQRGLEAADGFMQKVIGKQVLEFGGKAFGKEIASKSIVTAVAKMGAKQGAKLATKSAMRAVPVLGTVLSGLYTGATTEGPLGRKIFAGLGDFGGTALGQLTTGGLGGGIVGGIGGEWGALEAYDRMFGNASSAKARELLVSDNDATAQVADINAKYDKNIGQNKQIPGLGNVPASSGQGGGIPLDLSWDNKDVTFRVRSGLMDQFFNTLQTRAISKATAQSGV